MSALCRREDIPAGQAIECPDPADPDGASLIVLEADGHIRAYRNICPHAGRPLNWAPGRFLYAHGQLVCAAHGAAFRPEDGHCIGGPCRGASLTAVDIEVIEGEVRVVG
jgi:nitrite reductase/ring-hydroxylating ferredoxin subunit